MSLSEPQPKPLFENQQGLWILKEYEIAQNLNLWYFLK